MTFDEWWEKYLMANQVYWWDSCAETVAEAAWNAALASRWQPIETAPKDKDILISDGETVSQGGWLTEEEWDGADYGEQINYAGWWFVGGINFKPTHWMPLPEPPREDWDAALKYAALQSEDPKRRLRPYEPGLD